VVNQVKIIRSANREIRYKNTMRICML